MLRQGIIGVVVEQHFGCAIGAQVMTKGIAGRRMQDQPRWLVVDQTLHQDWLTIAEGLEHWRLGCAIHGLVVGRRQICCIFITELCQPQYLHLTLKTFGEICGNLCNL